MSKPDARKGLGIMKRIILALAFSAVAVCGTAKTVSAQEILLEGPLAGEPAVRKLVQYREMRFSAGPQFGYTLLNDYMHNFLIGARLEFNFLDWLGVGFVGYFSANAPTKLTRHISNSEDIGGTKTIPAESNWPSYTGATHFEKQVSQLRGLYLLQASVVPFRGKLALFEKLFVAVDGYVFLGGGIVHYEERKGCKGSNCGTWSAEDPVPELPKRGAQITGTFTLGVGFMVYFNEWFAVNLEYRIAPFKWNAGGTDEAGQAGDQWVLDDDEEDELYWDSRPRGTKGNYPDGDLDDSDRTWNANQSIALGFIFHFPFEPRIDE